MSESSRFNDIYIDGILIRSYNGKQEYELKHMFSEIRIYESMFSSSMNVDITLEDPTDLISSMPIIGQETVYLGFRSLSVKSLNMLTLTVYAIEDIQRENESMSYKLKLITNDFTINFENKISRYVEGSASSIAVGILNDDLDSNKLIDVESSDDYQQLVIPNMTPLRCLNWLSEKASVSGGSFYVFFENSKHFVFKSIESFFNDDILTTFKDVGKNIHSYGENQEYENTILISYKVLSSFNVIDNIVNGMYNSKVYGCDVVHRKVKYKQHSWMNNSEDYSIDNREGYPLLSKNMDNTLLDHMPDHISVVSHNNINTYNISDNILERNYGNQLFENLKLNIEVPGNSDIRVGSILGIEIPKKKPTEKLMDIELNPLYFGKWLAVNIVHIIKNGSYTMSIDIVKDRTGSLLD